MELEIKIHKQQQLAYIRKQITDAFGFNLRFLPNMNAAIVYSKSTNMKDVVRSVEILLQDLKMRAELEASAKKAGGD